MRASVAARRSRRWSGGDVNGDGAHNDRAFIIRPESAPLTRPSRNRHAPAGSTRSQTRVGECLTSQFGRIADRNSCRDGWTQSLSMRPGSAELPSWAAGDDPVDAQNVLTGLDQLFHGANGLRGWGEGRRADATLLDVRGFDRDKAASPTR